MGRDNRIGHKRKQSSERDPVKFDRRSFIAAGGATILLSLVGRKIDDYVIVNRVDDPSPLERFLTGGNSEPLEWNDSWGGMADISSIISASSRPRMPGYIYALPDGGGKALAGKCAVLNREGYFISTSHLIEPIIQAPNRYSFVFYDTESGGIMPAEILSYSFGNQILLGRALVPNGFEAPDLHLTQSQTSMSEEPYGMYLNQLIPSEIDVGNKVDDSYKQGVNHISVDFRSNNVLCIAFMHEMSDGQSFTVFETTIPFGHGDSGSPLFTLSNDIGGIFLGSIRDGGMQLPLGMYISILPSIIRKSINFYIDHC